MHRHQYMQTYICVQTCICVWDRFIRNSLRGFSIPIGTIIYILVHHRFANA